jgi:hypothetical protein
MQGQQNKHNRCGQPPPDWLLAHLQHLSCLGTMQRCNAAPCHQGRQASRHRTGRSTTTPLLGASKAQHKRLGKAKLSTSKAQGSQAHTPPAGAHTWRLVALTRTHTHTYTHSLPPTAHGLPGIDSPPTASAAPAGPPNQNTLSRQLPCNALKVASASLSSWARPQERARRAHHISK